MLPQMDFSLLMFVDRIHLGLYNHDDFISWIRRIPEAQVYTFLGACRHRRAYRTLALATIYLNKLHEVFTRKLWEGFVNDITAYLTLQGMWSTLWKLVNLGPDDDFFDNLIRAMTVRAPLTDQTKELYELTVNRCSPNKVIEAFDEVILHPETDTEKLEWFLFSRAEGVRREIAKAFHLKPFLAELVFATYIQRILSEMEPYVDEEYIYSLGLAEEAGVFSVFPILQRENGSDSAFSSVMGTAVRYCQYDLVQFLYKTGATTKRELYRLSRHPLVISDDPERLEAITSNPRIREYLSQENKRIRKFLTRKASQLHSLQKLALQEVSKHLGWGYVRATNVEDLPIPNIIKDKFRR